MKIRYSPRARYPSPVSGVASEQEKAYFAGYTDAEGCIGIYSYIRGGAKYWFSAIHFGQTQPVVVERMHALYGGCISVRKRDRRRRQKELRIQGFCDVQRFLLDVMPYLREKRAQAEIVLNQFDPRGRDKTNQRLLQRLVQLKALSLGHITIKPRLALSPQAHLRCQDCTAKAFSRGFCAKHYQKAKREGRIVTNRKGAGVPFAYGRILKEFEAPYFAGYFDGDGCISISPEKRRWYPRIHFSQTRPDALIDLHAIYGGSLTVELAKDDRRRPKLHYQLTQRYAVFAFLRDIRPFVVEKLNQVELFLKRYRPDMPSRAGQMLKEQLSKLKRCTFNERQS